MLKSMAGRQGLPGIKCIDTSSATVAANGELWTLGFNPHNTMWGQFDPGGSCPCAAQNPSASQF